METINTEALQADFEVFEISEELGFILKEPLTNLPDYYRVWLDLANNLTPLIESRKLRDLVHKMPVLNPHLLSNHRELRLAQLVLGFITMGYVWQDGQHAPAQILPKALAWPYWVVSRRLGLPPILTYADSVLANWKLKDPKGAMEIGNMDLIVSLPGEESCRGFFIVSLFVEMAASSGIMGALVVMHAMKTSDLSGVRKGLIKVTQSLRKMKETFKLMHNHVDPTAFHGTLRIFFSGWRDNPMLPRGLLYEGVSNEPISLSGGSAAQSSAIQCFDALLRVRHEDETGSYLTRMRDYMPPAHRQLIETLSALPPLRDLISSCSSSDLCQAYNACVSALVDLRSYHLSIVTKYVVMPANQARAVSCPLGGMATLKGTGGSDLMVFLKDHVDPTAFHGTLRIFLSGWRDNPMLPRGLLYEGVSNEPITLSGVSAAQSSAIQCFDALLRVRHEDETGSYLTRMRDYMPPAHRQLIETLSALPPLRDLISSCSSSDLCQAYNACVSALVDLRSYHLSIVTKYVIMPANQARAVSCPLCEIGYRNFFLALPLTMGVL